MEDAENKVGDFENRAEKVESTGTDSVKDSQSTASSDGAKKRKGDLSTEEPASKISKTTSSSNPSDADHAEDATSGISNDETKSRKTDSKPPEVNVAVLTNKELPKTSKRLDLEQLPIDILLLTVKDCEFLACLSLLTRYSRMFQKELGDVYIGNIGEMKIAVMKCRMGAAGPGSAAGVVRDAVKALTPKAVFCVGYCGGLQPVKVKLGDVVISEVLITYAPSKVTKEGIEERGDRVPLKPNLAKVILNAAAGWNAPLRDPAELEVAQVRGALLSGPQVVDDSDLREALLNRFPDAIAIEMEGEGVYSAAHDLDVEWVIIKGVSDFADGKNSEKNAWGPFASIMAASFVAHILRNPVSFEDWPHYNNGKTSLPPSSGQLTSTADPTLPYKGAHFTGREADVQTIVQNVTDPNPSRIIIVVGIPGMGKTQVAIHVSHLLKEEHKKAVIFIEEKQKLTEICSEILREINPLAPRLSESHDMVTIAKRRLKELKEKKVIVLDSVQGIQQQGKEFDDFLSYVETYAPHVQLIITTREDVGFRSPNIYKVRLNGLDSESSAKLLQDLLQAKLLQAPNCEERHIKELGNLCGGIPLVLVNCAGLLEEGFSPEDLLALLKENLIPLLEANAEHVYDALRQFLVNISENIKANLVRLSVFPSAFSVKDMKALFGDKLQPEAVKNTMIRRSLLRKIDNEKLILHRLVREFLKAERKLLNMDDVGNDAEHKFNQHYLELLETSSKQFINKTLSQDAIFTFRTEKANILEMFKNFLQEGGDKKKVESCIDVANSTKVLDFLAKVLSPPSECIELYERFYHIAEASSDTRRLADSLTALGFLRLCKEAHQEVSDDTLKKFQRAYEIGQKLPKKQQRCETHAHTISKLGLCYALQGEVEKGLKLIQEAVDLRKELGVPLYVAVGYCDLGNAHRASGDHEQAINIWKTETLPVYKDVLGDHPWTASILQYIAGSYRCLAQSESAESGTADRAERYSREALGLRIKLLGEHQDTARSHVDLSDSLIIKAMKQLEKAIEIQNDVLGEEHETTKKTLKKLEEIQSMVE